MVNILPQDIKELKMIANRIRRNVLTTIAYAGVGHPGGSLSEVDILTVLYFHVMKVDPGRPEWPQRDRFILSKGHGAVGLYATLVERGFFSAGLLDTFGRIDSLLQVHPDRHLTPGIELSSGALGQGFSVALGLALAAQLNEETHRVYCLLGDGECQEGQIWEAAEAAAHYKMDNLTAILDYNRVQLMGTLSEIMEISPIAEKWRSFNWHAIEVDGHDIPALIEAFALAQNTQGKPSIIIARTVKGKGVSYMEGQSAWHGKPPTKEQLEQALCELDGEVL